MYPKLSIIFPTFNNFNNTQKCLKSIEHILYPKQMIEAIVIDNNSSDNTVTNLKKQFPKVKLFPQKSNLGFAKAVNIGAKKATGQFLFFTNNDVSFEANFFNKLIPYVLKNPRIGVCGGKVIAKIKNKTHLDGAANISRITSRINRLTNYQKTQEVDYISGSGLLIKKRIFNIAGGFDEEFPFYFEDVDLCLRIKYLGLDIIYYPKCTMFHNQSSTALKMPQNWQNDVWYAGKIRIIAKHFPYWSKLIAIFCQFIFCFWILITTGKNILTSFIKAIRTTPLFQNPLSQLIKKEKNNTRKILNYYSEGEVFTSRNSAHFQQIVLKHFYEILQKNHKLKKWKVLEFGVGHGWNLPQMVKFFGKITGIDIAKTAILESREYGFKSVQLYLAKDQLLSFATETFDLVIATEVLEHVPDLEKTVQELKRVIKKGGYIIISVPTYLNLRGISKRIIEAKFGTGTWEPARSHPGGYERLLTPGKILSLFRDFKLIKTRGADYGTAWSLPMIPFHPKSLTPFFEVTLGKFPPLKKFGMNFYLLAQKK